MTFKKRPKKGDVRGTLIRRSRETWPDTGQLPLGDPTAYFRLAVGVPVPSTCGECKTLATSALPSGKRAARETHGVQDVHGGLGILAGAGDGDGEALPAARGRSLLVRHRHQQINFALDGICRDLRNASIGKFEYAMHAATNSGRTS